MESSFLTLRDYFPFPSIRDNQVRVINEIEKAIHDGKKYIILEAPTGFGKSPVAVTVAKYFGESHTCTATKDLQAQYQRDFPFLRLVKGRNNFVCIDAKEKVEQTFNMALTDVITAEEGACVLDSNYDCPYMTRYDDYEVTSSIDKLHPETERITLNDTAISVLQDRSPCDYYHQKWIALRSAHTLYNYKYFLSMIKTALRMPEGSKGLIKKKKLLIIDECHDFENELKDFNSVSLSTFFLRTILPDFKIPDNPHQDLLYIPKTWMPILRDTLDQLVEYREGADLSEQKTRKRVIIVDRYIDKLNTLIYELEDLDSLNWVVSRIERKNNAPKGEIVKVTFLPLSVSRYSRDVFKFGDTVLMMSATILSKDAFCRMIGMPDSEVAFITTGSEFPKTNRPIYTLNIGKMSAKTMDSILPNVARKCDELMNRYSNVKGIIHTTSYKQLEFIKNNLSPSNKARLIETGEDFKREEVVERHLKETRPTVLISPSFHQGLDLKDDASRFQIIVKIPYPDLTDKWIKAKMEKDPRWYTWRTCLNLVQSYGRSVRSKTDYADTYILDSNIHLLMEQARNMLPKWFIEGFVGGI